MRRLLALGAALGLACCFAAGIGSAATFHLTATPVSSGSLGFTPPVFVDTTLGGGEPFVAYSSKSGLLVYTAHEGTTHIFASQAPLAPAESGGWIANYRNQVNIWTSADNGKTWQRVDWMGTGFFASPLEETGFSDPDLTFDEAGNIYNTGIDLANDALFSSADGGKTWNVGTIQCHNGDRPWLAGAHANEVFLGTDTEDTGGHTIYRSTDRGATCSSNGFNDFGNTYTGDGKLFYDHKRGNLVEPIVNFDSKTNQLSLGVGVLRDASKAFDTGKGAFRPTLAAPTTLFAHWPSMAIDAAGNYYLVWDTDDRLPNSTGGCAGSQPDGLMGNLGLSSVETETPLANSIMMVVSHDGGLHWDKPVTVAHDAGHRVLWPWVTAGSAGNVGVVWYQYDRITDPDCGSGNITVEAARITGANAPGHTVITAVNASGRPISTNAICQGGTNCAATGAVTGEDRRLGDYFTVATDQRGCMIIATGDTTITDAITGQQSPVSHPIFMRQNSGPGLTGSDCGATTTSSGGGTVASGQHHGSQPPAVLGKRQTLANTGTENETALGLAALIAGLALAVRLRRHPR